MNPTEANRSFRQKLLVHVGVSVGLVFVLMFLLLWMGSTIWFRVDAERFLRIEAESIAGYVVRAGGVLDVEAYTWNEPHHLFAESRIDPIFVQIFDAQRRELFATQNIGEFPDGAWPGYLIVHPDELFSPSEGLETRFIGQARLYFLSYPLRTVDGATIGYLQAARYVPDIEGQVVRILWLSGAILIILLGGLLFSLYSRAGNLLRPLHSIARTADGLSASELDVRLPTDDDMDLESRVLSQSFNRLLDRLDAAFTDMRRFTSNAAHQLQTPLTVLKGHVDVALRRDRDAESYRTTLEVVRDEIANMTRMVRGLLALSRLEGSGGETTFEKVRIQDLWERLLLLHESERERISVTSSPDLCIQGNPEWLLVLFDNLLDNALKYAPRGPVKLAAESADGRVRIEVSDSGTGIAEEDLEHLTERFYRGKNARDRGIRGDGLGLSLVERLVSLHGGEWSIDSRHGQGTRVIVSLPAC